MTRIGLSWVGVPSIGAPRPRAILFDVGTMLIHARGQLLLDEMAADGVDTTGITGTDAARALVLASEARHVPLPSLLEGTEKVAITLLRLLRIEHPAAAAACLRGLAREDLYQDLDADTVPTLTALRDEGTRLGVVSNSSGTLRDDLAAFDLLRFFDVVVDSTIVGYEKPHPHPFRVALRELDLRGEECWYVGDGLFNDVLGARGAGYGFSVLLDRFGNFAAVPDIVRIRRLAELTDLLNRAEPARAGPARAEPARAGPVRVVPARAGPAPAGPARAGPAPAGPAGPGAVTACPPVAADLREPPPVLGRRHRADLHMGSRYRPPAQDPAAQDARANEQSPVCAARLVDACRPARLPLDGNWELTVVVGFRDTESGARLRNAVAVLAALHDQNLPRDAYRIVAVEQDDQPRHRHLVAKLADRYVHAPPGGPDSGRNSGSHGGPYNRSWAHNIGAMATGGAERYLCFLDADVLPDRDFLAVSHDYLRDSGARALLPHASLLYLDAQSSQIAVRQRLLEGAPAVDIEDCYGYRLMTNRGGCLIVESALFHAIGRYDDEDNEFYERLAVHTTVAQLAFDLPHLHHPRQLERSSSPSPRTDGGISS